MEHRDEEQHSSPDEDIHTARDTANNTTRETFQKKHSASGVIGVILAFIILLIAGIYLFSIYNTPSPENMQGAETTEEDSAGTQSESANSAEGGQGSAESESEFTPGSASGATSASPPPPQEDIQVQ